MQTKPYQPPSESEAQLVADINAAVFATTISRVVDQLGLERLSAELRKLGYALTTSSEYEDLKRKARPTKTN